MGGTDDPSNLIELTITEHAEAHLRLWEEHGIEYDLIAYKSLSGMIDNATAADLARRSFNQKYWSVPENVIQHSMLIRRMHETDPTIAKKISASHKRRLSDPEQRRLQSERTKTSYQNPELLKIRSEQMKKRYEDPEYRERVSKNIRRALAEKKARAQEA